jgi:heme-degrading monooxygenase HmoA
MFVVVFDVCPQTAQMQPYLDFAKLLRPELEQIVGFIDNERFCNTQHPDQILSLSTWANEKALIRWRTHAQHHRVQSKGRLLVFADYRLRVGEITNDSHLPPGQNLDQQRFDSTESSHVTTLSILELSATANDSSLTEQISRVAAIDPLQPPVGWCEGAMFTSLTNVGKQLWLAGWNTSSAAEAWYRTQIVPLGAVGLRQRLVRVIRSYGIHDRREAPQYYPEVAATVAIW